MVGSQATLPMMSGADRCLIAPMRYRSIGAVKVGTRTRRGAESGLRIFRRYGDPCVLGYVLHEPDLRGALPDETRNVLRIDRQRNILLDIGGWSSWSWWWRRLLRCLLAEFFLGRLLLAALIGLSCSLSKRISAAVSSARAEIGWQAAKAPKAIAATAILLSRFLAWTLITWLPFKSAVDEGNG
jgi:hypothetical protein